MDWPLYILKVLYCVAMVLLLFNLTIFVHEYGHFLLARWRKLRVDEFAIWFGPALWEKTIGGVRFVLRSIPLGGYVKLPQLQPDDPIEGKSETPREQLPYAHPKDRLPTLFAGSVFNFIFAILIACVLWGTGIPVHKSTLDMTISYVPANSAEERAGIRPGDKLVAINGVKVSNWQEVLLETALGSYETATLSLQRDGQPITVQIIPEPHPIYKFRDLDLESPHSAILEKVVAGGPASKAGLEPGDKVVSFDGIPVMGVNQFIRLIHERPEKTCEIVVNRNGKEMPFTVTPKREGGVGRMGVMPAADKNELTLIHPNPIQQIEEVILQMQRLVMALSQPKKTGIGADSISGPLGIFGMLYDLVGRDIRLALSFLVLLNVNLAILNLLPIPVLDGGHIMFTLLEWVRKKPLNYKLMEAIQSTFVILLLGFILYVTFNDGRRWARTKGWLQEKQAPAQQAPVTPAPAPAK